MKKNLFAILALSAVLASSTAAFAENDINEPAQPDTEMEEVIQGDVMLINETSEENPVVEMFSAVKTPSYISNTVTVVSSDKEMISTTTDVENKADENNTVNFVVNEDTLVYDNNGNKKALSDVAENASITVFSDSYAPVTLNLPVQYTAKVIVINGEDGENVNVDTYAADEEGFTNFANTLNVKTDEATKVVDKDDKKYDGELDKNDLIVFYGVSTRSIPAQTTATKIVVLGENETALAQLESNVGVLLPEETEAPAEDIEDIATVETVAVSDMFTAENGTVMVPLREIAEKFGFTVKWNGETRTVTLDDGIYSFSIDENKYIVGKMKATELGNCPVIKNDYTYVPVEFFTELVELPIDVVVE